MQKGKSMKSKADFSIIRTYSTIRGLQSQSQDEYSVYDNDGEYIIKYCSQKTDRELVDEIGVSGLSFDEIKSLLVYISENSLRFDLWKDFIKDYCLERGAKIS